MTLIPAVILKAVVVGALLPMLKTVAPPFMEAKQAGAALNAAEKVTVAIVPVVAVPPTIVRVPRVLLQENPVAQTTEVIPDPPLKVAVPVGSEMAAPHGPEVEANNPPVDPCTQFPLLRALSVKFAPCTPPALTIFP
jgi:hypothetical protein